MTASTDPQTLGARADAILERMTLAQKLGR
jgi:hypothetical protein